MNKREFDEILKKIEESNCRILIPKKINMDPISEINKNLGICMGDNILGLLDEIAERIIARESKLINNLDEEEIEEKLREQIKEAEEFFNKTNTIKDLENNYNGNTLDKKLKCLHDLESDIDKRIIAREIKLTINPKKETEKKCSCGEYVERIKKLEEANSKMSDELSVLRSKVKKYSQALIDLKRADLL